MSLKREKLFSDIFDFFFLSVIYFFYKCGAFISVIFMYKCK